MSTLGARIWPWVPVGLLGTMLSGLSTMALIATNDPGFALERDYYKKAVGYDSVILQRGQNARLHWSIDAEVGKVRAVGPTPLTVKVSDALGPVSGARVSVEALRNASASTVLDARLIELTPGEYRALLPLSHGGLWELRLTVEHGRDRFTAVERRDVSEATP